jgi:hypothetical protein
MNKDTLTTRINKGESELKELVLAKEKLPTAMLQCMANTCKGLDDADSVTVVHTICDHLELSKSRKSELTLAGRMNADYAAMEKIGLSVSEKTFKDPDTYGQRQAEKCVLASLRYLRKHGEKPTQKVLLEQYKKSKVEADKKAEARVPMSQTKEWLLQQVRNAQEKYGKEWRGFDAVFQTIDAMTQVESAGAVAETVTFESGNLEAKVDKLLALLGK